MSSSSDNSLAIWDLRKLSDAGKIKSVASGVHSKTCQSAYFAPDGTSLSPGSHTCGQNAKLALHRQSNDEPILQAC